MKGVRGSKEYIPKKSVLKSIRFPYDIIPVNLTFSFFKGKFKVTPELFEDMWEYHALNPNVLLKAIEGHLHLLKDSEEIDMRFNLHGLGKFDLNAEALIEHEVIFMATDQTKLHKNMGANRVLSVVRLQGPGGIRIDEDSWDILIPK